MEEANNFIAEQIMKDLKVELTPEETKKAQAMSDSINFADEIFEQCRQRNFTIEQFGKITAILDSRYKLMVLEAASTVRIGDTRI